MSDPTCLHCDNKLNASELRAGWCEGCGKKLPSFVRAAAPPAPPAQKAKASSGGSGWGFLGGFLALLGMGSAVASARADR